MNLYEAKTPLLGKGGEFRLILFSPFAANCPARSGSLKFKRPHCPSSSHLVSSCRASLLALWLVAPGSRSRFDMCVSSRTLWN